MGARCRRFESCHSDQKEHQNDAPFSLSVTDLTLTSCEQSKELALGERAKTTECCFCEVKSTKQGAIGKICDFDAWRLCDLTGGVAEDVAPSNPEPSIRVSHSFVYASLDSLCSHSVDFALKKQLSTVFSLLTFRPKGASKRCSFFFVGDRFDANILREKKI